MQKLLSEEKKKHPGNGILQWSEPLNLIPNGNINLFLSDAVKSAAREDQENQANRARASHLHPLLHVGSLINAAEQ